MFTFLYSKAFAPCSAEEQLARYKEAVNGCCYVFAWLSLGDSDTDEPEFEVRNALRKRQCSSLFLVWPGNRHIFFRDS